MKNILVTGSAGFIGFHLVKELLKRGDKVTGLDIVNNYYDVNLKYARLEETGIKKNNIDYNKIVNSEKHGQYSFIKLDLIDSKSIDYLFNNNKYDVVVNLAAQAGVRYSLENPKAYIDSNIGGFLNILEGCRNYGVKHLVYASSSSVYGNNTKMPLSTSDNVDHPISLYAASKKTNELMAHTYSHLFKIPTTGLRFFTVYGPWGRPDMALFLFTKAMLEGKPIKVFNNGNMVRDFTYIDDIVQGIIRVIDNSAEVFKGDVSDASRSKSAPYKIYNIGNSSPVNLMDYILEIESALNKKAIKEFLPMQPGDVSKTFADVSDLQNDLNYKPDITIKVGIRNFINWYKEYFSISSN